MNRRSFFGRFATLIAGAYVAPKLVLPREQVYEVVAGNDDYISSYEGALGYNNNRYTFVIKGTNTDLVETALHDIARNCARKIDEQVRRQIL